MTGKHHRQVVCGTDLQHVLRAAAGQLRFADDRRQRTLLYCRLQFNAISSEPDCPAFLPEQQAQGITHADIRLQKNHMTFLFRFFNVAIP
jgi:hypothetical protein